MRFSLLLPGDAKGLEAAVGHLEQFRNYCGLREIARCGFPWEKTTKRPLAPRISCGAALAEDNLVRLSSRKVACSFVGSTNHYRKSGFGLHQLRNCSMARFGDFVTGIECGTGQREAILRSRGRPKLPATAGQGAVA